MVAGDEGNHLDFVRFEAAQDPAIDTAVASIVADVRRRGDAAVLEYTARFDDVHASWMSDLEIGRDEMRRAHDGLGRNERTALDRSAGTQS